MFDAAIIGSGPAGLSAALTLKLRGKQAIWFGSLEQSAKIEKSEKIANYPGVGLVTGAELNARFAAHAREMELKPNDKMVTAITRRKNGFMLLADNELFEARTVLLCTGVANAKSLPGEVELLGKGVSYCATCDGFLYRDKTIAVLCGAKRYEHEVEFLAGLVKKVYLFTTYSDCEIMLPNVEHSCCAIQSLQGENHLQAIALADGSSLQVEGLFILRSAIAPATLLPGLALQGAHIVTARDFSTNLPGCYAAGDCTGTPYQIAKAVGEGNIAALSIVQYLSRKANEQ